MAKYQVTFYYHTSATVVVTAKDKDEALIKGNTEVCKKKYSSEILQNLTEDNTPDVEEIEE